MPIWAVRCWADHVIGAYWPTGGRNGAAPLNPGSSSVWIRRFALVWKTNYSILCTSATASAAAILRASLPTSKGACFVGACSALPPKPLRCRSDTPPGRSERPVVRNTSRPAQASRKLMANPAIPLKKRLCRASPQGLRRLDPTLPAARSECQAAADIKTSAAPDRAATTRAGAAFHTLNTAAVRPMPSAGASIASVAAAAAQQRRRPESR